MNERAKNLIAQYCKEDGKPIGLIMAQVMILMWSLCPIFFGEGYVVLSCAGVIIAAGLVFRQQWARWLGAVGLGVVGIWFLAKVIITICSDPSGPYQYSVPMFSPAIVVMLTFASSLNLVFGKRYFMSEDEDVARHEKYKHIRDDILEDGKVTGPGKYVRHKKWGAGHGPMTDGDTKGVKNPGWHGTPWP